MRDNWTDFEHYVFDKLEKMSEEISGLKTKAAIAGGVAGIVGVAVCEMFIGYLFK